MGLLDQLWDDTVAGPQPENGLGKLRKHKTFSVRAGSGKESCEGSVRSSDEISVAEEALKVTRRIMIVKPPGYQSASPPVSPAGSSTPPVSPFSEGILGPTGIRLIAYIVSSAPFGGFDVATSPAAYTPP